MGQTEGMDEGVFLTVFCSTLSRASPLSHSLERLFAISPKMASHRCDRVARVVGAGPALMLLPAARPCCCRCCWPKEEDARGTSEKPRVPLPRLLIDLLRLELESIGFCRRERV